MTDINKNGHQIVYTCAACDEGMYRHPYQWSFDIPEITKLTGPGGTGNTGGTGGGPGGGQGGGPINTGGGTTTTITTYNFTIDQCVVDCPTYNFQMVNNPELMRCEFLGFLCKNGNYKDGCKETYSTGK